MILITGATDGIGKETAFQLVKKGYNILIHGRNNERLEQTRNQLKEIRNDTKIETVCADFCSLKEVNSMANKIKSNYQEINILINNAGVYEKRLKYSKDEYEMTYAVNFLAHYSLSLQILPVLLNNKQARIINLSSLTHSWAKIDWDNINAEKSYDATNAYSLSKLFNLQFSNELHRRLIDKEICINAVHPGVIDTKLLRAGWGGGARI
ncbi:MAG: SDR family NAD(P)-dependent oxidoreductase, partial [Bacteroidales bacterium]|nr:SDR family NAD(P)-dependent oxidoreductase [Bacteroidales bacterium]